MKLSTGILIFIALASVVSAQEFASVKENMSKQEVVKLVGNPSKIMQSDDKQTECFLWYRSDAAWYVCFRNGTALTSAVSMQEWLQGILDLMSSQTGIGEETSPSSEPKSQRGESSTQQISTQKIASKIRVEVLECKVITTWSDEKKAGCRFKIKNNSGATIYDLAITVYFLDRAGKAFYEETYYPVNSGSFTNTIVLRPNYSIVYPSNNEYVTASNIDINDWAEGKVRIEIKNIGTKPPDGQ